VATTCTKIGLSRTRRVAAGTIVLARWGDNQPVPGLDGFKAALEPYGEVAQLSYASVHHVVLKISRDMTELELQAAIANSNAGTAAQVMAVSGVDFIVDLELLAGDARQGFLDSIEAVTEGFKNASAAALWLAKYGPYAIAAIVVVALIIVIVLARKKK
jgi:hypothetical protein